LLEMPARAARVPVPAEEDMARVRVAFLAMCAAVRTFYGHRMDNVLKALVALDSDLTAQWYGINAAKTVTAGLSIASAVCIFLVPPVGIGLGIGAASTGAVTSLSDFVAQKVKEGWFSKTMKTDEENRSAFLVAVETFQTIAADFQVRFSIDAADLFHVVSSDDQSWILAAGAHVTGVACGIGTQVTLGSIQMANIAKCFTQLAELGEGVHGVVTVGTAGATVTAVGGNGAVAASRVVASTAVRTLGCVAAVFSVGDMIHSWSTSSNVQGSVRKSIKDIKEECRKMEEAYGDVVRSPARRNASRR